MKMPYKFFQDIDTLMDDTPDIPMTLKANIMSQCDNLIHDKEVINGNIEVDENKMNDLFDTIRKTTDIKLFILAAQTKKEIPVINV